MGLPDALLGSAWPVMQVDLNVPLSFAGFIAMTITAGTVVASLISFKLTKKFSAKVVVAFGFLVTSGSLFLFSFSTQFWQLLLIAAPYGLGVGSIDAALNGYVAGKYKSRQLNWLNCAWAAGAAISPFIMSYALTSAAGWSMGYLTVAIIQVSFAALLFITLPLWKKGEKKDSSSQVAVDSCQLPVVHEANNQPPKKPSFITLLGTKNLKLMLVAFFCYITVESTAGLWASSFLVHAKGVEYALAALFASFLFLGILSGRFVAGFVSDKIGNKKMIRIGICIIVVGILLILLSFTEVWLALTGLIILGIGIAPIYPAVLASTPHNFGKENAQAIVGIQMAAAYMGGALMPPLFGLIANNISIQLYPVFLLLFVVIMFTLIEAFNKKVNKQEMKDKR